MITSINKAPHPTKVPNQLQLKIRSGNETPTQMNSKIKQMSLLCSRSKLGTKYLTLHPRLQSNLHHNVEHGSKQIISSLYKWRYLPIYRLQGKLKFNCQRILYLRQVVIRLIQTMRRVWRGMVRNLRCLRIESKIYWIWALMEVIMKRTKRTMMMTMKNVMTSKILKLLRKTLRSEIKRFTATNTLYYRSQTSSISCLWQCSNVTKKKH